MIRVGHSSTPATSTEERRAAHSSSALLDLRIAQRPAVTQVQMQPDRSMIQLNVVN